MSSSNKLYAIQFHIINWLLILLCRVFTSYITGCDWSESQLWLIAQSFIALCSIAAVPKSDVLWVWCNQCLKAQLTWWVALVLFLELQSQLEEWLSLPDDSLHLKCNILIFLNFPVLGSDNIEVTWNRNINDYPFPYCLFN